MPQTQPSSIPVVSRTCFLLLISFFVICNSFAQVTTIFTSQTPVAALNNDHQPTVGQELGVKFKSSAAGYIMGVRFLKQFHDSATHIGELYSGAGVRLAQATFTNETDGGWQVVQFATAVAITANTIYTAAYFSSKGDYTEDNNYFLNNSVTNGPLTAIADGTNGASGTDPGNGQGTFKYTSSPAFPNQLYKSANYWVDVIYSPVAPIPAVANAGMNQTIDNVSQLPIILDGSGSTGTIFSYLWTEVSSPPGGSILPNPDQVKTQAVEVFRGTHIYQLSVNGGASTSRVTVQVNPPPPIANAGPDQTITSPVSTVTLDGTGSSGVIYGSSWNQVSGPNTATITNPANLITTVTGLVPGIYVFDLNEDGFSNSQVKIIVLSTGGGTITNLFTTQTPVAGTDNDHRGTVGQEVGVKFTSAAPGTINGIRFYKTSGNTGTHIGELYTSAGIRLAQATFTNESASGWQQVSFSTPVTITANTTYVAAYFSSLGNYTEENDYFLHHSVTNAPLTAPADGTNGGSGTDPGTGQGTFKYSATPVFPNQLYKSANYWVDVIFSSAGSPVVANAGPDQTYPALIQTITLNANNSTGPITSYLWTLVSGPNVPVIATPNASNTTVTGLAIGTYIFKLSLNGGISTSQVSVKLFYGPPAVSANPTPTVILPTTSTSLIGGSQGLMDGTTTSLLWTEISGPNTAVIVSPNGQIIGNGIFKTDVTGLIQGTYVFQVLAMGPGGKDSARTTVTVIPASQSFISIFTTQTPVAATDNDHQPTVGHEVGVKFSSSTAGYITGVRFYKTSGNTGTHIGELYSSAGTRLAQATFVNETATGWQTVTFSAPVAITAGTTYTAAYFSSLGYYTEDNNYFLNHSVINSPLTAPADGTNGASGTDPGNGQGTYKYTAAPAFPNQLYKAANYWVDAIFSTTNTLTAEPAHLNNAVAVDSVTGTAEKLSWFLGQNYPNPVPMSQNTRIEYSVPISSKVELVLYDMQGRPVKIMVDEMKNAGRYSYDLNTGVLAKGLYIYTLHSGSFHDVKKLVVQ
jgi:Domain of unknown function (DUF4082)/Secretion system C-terminal sorting domain